LAADVGIEMRVAVGDYIEVGNFLLMQITRERLAVRGITTPAIIIKSRADSADQRMITLVGTIRPTRVML
jgi:hypothetical protein